MNRLIPLRRRVVFVLALLLAGCSSIDQRIAENRNIFAGLSPETQQTIRDGHVNLGFTPLMVYMALGKPSEINTSADGKEVTWTFMYYNTPDGEVVQMPKAYLGGMTASRTLFNQPTSRMMPGAPAAYMAEAYGANGYGTVAGEEDLRRGRVRPAGNPIRDATMRDAMDGPRQDLVIWFTDGAVTGFELVHQT